MAVGLGRTETFVYRTELETLYCLVFLVSKMSCRMLGDRKLIKALA